VGACHRLDLHDVVDRIRRVAEAVRHLQDLGNRVAKRSAGTPPQAGYSLLIDPFLSCATPPAHTSTRPPTPARRKRVHGRRAEDGRDGMDASGIDEGHEAVALVAEEAAVEAAL
jgi:hypothetical protein